MLIKKYIKSCAVLAAVSIMLINPQLLMQAVKSGMILCYESVIPSLYIFIVLANYRAQPDIMDIISLPLRWYGKLMKIEDNYFSGSLIVSLLGGFAVGAGYMNILKQKGYSNNAIRVLSVALTNNSFAFCVFTVGTTYLGNTFAGFIIYISLITASFITAFILSFFMEYNNVVSAKSIDSENISIVSSIRKSVESMLVICGFVIIFNLICEVISLYVIDSEILTVILSIFSEVTCGILKIISVFGKNVYLICFALGIFPVSTLCQVYYFTDNPSVVRTLLLSRLIHIPVSLLILSVLIQLFPVVMIVSSDVVPVVSAVSDSMEISSALFMITVVFLLIFDKNKLFTKRK